MLSSTRTLPVCGQGIDFSAAEGTHIEDILFVNQRGGAVLVSTDSVVKKIA